MKMNKNIFMCKDFLCPKRSTCYRYMKVLNEETIIQDIFYDFDNEVCHYFLKFDECCHIVKDNVEDVDRKNILAIRKDKK